MNNYSIEVTTEPATEPISLEEAKTHLRVPTDNEDANISGIYLPAARRRVESEIGRAMINTVYEYSIDAFPGMLDSIQLPRNPVQSVASITYIDSDGIEQTLSSDLYVLDLATEPARIKPAWGETWPTVRRRTDGQTVKVTFTAGYGTDAADVPAGLKQATLLLLGHYFYHREAVVMGAAVRDLPRAVDDLLQAHSYGDEFIDYGGRY